MSARAPARARHTDARPSLATLAAVWLRRPSLDRSIACGANDSPLLRVRAAQLVSPASRLATAELIELALTETTARARLSDDGASPLHRPVTATALRSSARQITAALLQ